MKNGRQSVLEQKGFFPCKLKELCERVGVPYSLYEVDPEGIVDAVVNERIWKGKRKLYLPFYETDDELRALAAQDITAVLTDHPISGVPCLVVKDPEAFTFQLLEKMYALIRLPAIIVVGSEGKTTTKRMLACVLQTEHTVSYQKENFNSFQALAYSLEEVDSAAELIIREVDEKRKNCLRNSSLILKPEFALVTNIAEAHLGIYGSREALIDCFRGVTAGMDENGIVIINGDDPYSLAAHFDARVIRVGMENTDCECLARNYREGSSGAEFDLCYAGETEHVRLSVHGVHNVYNAMMAWVVGKEKGVSVANIRKGLLSYQNSGIRQNICRLNDVLIYADCYNASATSVRFALQCFDALPAGTGKKVAVLGDIAEIGGFEEETYRAIAKALDSTGVDIVVTCGQDSQMLHGFLTRELEKHHTRDLQELNQVLQNLKTQGCGSYLFKASRIMELEKSIQSVFPEHYARLNGKKAGPFVRVKNSIKRRIKRLLRGRK